MMMASKPMHQEICEFIGVAPEQYCADPEKLHVKRTSETRAGVHA